ncbi:MAG: carboxypeptidase regulatory-like domain-containing protein [Firmicutes bacterium]|nr:carboxypeptidase regulatory-like domain-containing protein [Bacillota bacterium]
MEHRFIGWWSLTVLAAALTFSLVACSHSPSATDAPTLTVTPTQFAVVPWSATGSQQSTATGTLTAGGHPLSGQTVLAQNGQHLTTDKDGHFTFLVDRSKLAHLTFATLTPNGQDGAHASVNVAYPIVIEQIVQNANQVEVHGRLEDANGNPPPVFRIANYRVSGTVHDASGKPVKGAIVSLVADSGEQWSKSKPTDAAGGYTLFFTPDEQTILRVQVGTTQYTLPPGRVFDFPENSSLAVEIKLPATGTTIHDQSGDLKGRTTLGAVYTGVAVGVLDGQGHPYYATAPTADGSFTLTLPSALWQSGKLSWFEREIDAFATDPIQPGQPLPASWRTQKPKATDPQGMSAHLPST